MAASPLPSSPSASTPAKPLCASVCRVAASFAVSSRVSRLCCPFLFVVSLLHARTDALQFQLPQPSFPGVSNSPSMAARPVPSAYLSVTPSTLPRLAPPSPRDLGLPDQKSPAAGEKLASFAPHALTQTRESACSRTPALGAACGDAELELEGQPTPLAMTLRSYLRCHVSLLSDTSPAFNNGNLMFLYRAADAHERLISPLELHTNAHHLPGAAAARTMVSLEPEALEAAVPPDSGVATDKQATQQAFAHELLKFEVRRLHRLLQFACAGQVRGEFLNRASTKVMLDLIQEAGVPLSTILDAFTLMSKFYEKKMPADAFKNHFKPSLDALVSQLLEIEKEFAAEEKTTSRPVLSKVTFEPEPDSRTLTPLLVDITTMGDKLPGVAAWNKKA
ncbi:conserved hypothetical protein [Neospora caninum Liverpool]|uniref:Uncharacterized protein n=1 Tax=Neospora caninum (strain Liverpool) TaxID=572307 RepID=F0V8Q0_NEOCL|nr:conserved hypothetical protein [Neospora caninum Liverpool]CBZ50091.1 conserved hypothetical protein [Neospora caninum Liverpool]CEL64686.1 TPA: hypothetical protein BN1204_005670 [Neospora caninum Liverpool]|eukprot:XP_003880126.1 conserved hypothetical protein [Neospora caninum Liverpool]